MTWTLRAVAAGVTALLSASGAAATEWETLRTQGDWVARAAAGTPDGRICAASTMAGESGVSLTLEAAEGIVSIVLTNPDWAVEEPGPVEGYRLDAGAEDLPLVAAFAYGDTLVADATDEILRHLAADARTAVHGPDGLVAEFSLAGSATAIRAMRECADL